MALIKELLGDYQAALQSRGQRPRGIERYIGQLRDFARWMGSTAVERVTPKHISRYQAHLARRCAVGTVRFSICVLRSFFQWVVEEELRDDDPTVQQQVPKRAPTIPRIPSRQQLARMRRVLAVMPDGLTQKQQWIWKRNRLVVMLIRFTGVRISEATALRWADIDLEQRTLTVHEGKGGKSRTIPLHKTLLAELHSWQSANPEHAVLPAYTDGRGFASYKAMAHIFERWLPAQGVKLTAHQLRHAFATELLRKKADVREVQELLGHASLETTQRYLHVDAERLRAAIDHLPAWDDEEIEGESGHDGEDDEGNKGDDWDETDEENETA
jgi:site-specific recombinase XerD